MKKVLTIPIPYIFCNLIIIIIIIIVIEYTKAPTVHYPADKSARDMYAGVVYPSAVLVRCGCQYGYRSLTKIPSTTMLTTSFQ